jgi:hypothetical protein
VIMAYVLARAAPDMIKFAPHLSVMRKMRAEAKAASTAHDQAAQEARAAPGPRAVPTEPSPESPLDAPKFGLARIPES